MSSEFDSSLEGDHARRAVAAQSHAQQSGGRRDGARQCAKAGLRFWLARGSCLIAGESKVGVVEEVEELRIEADGYVLRELNFFGYVKFGISEMRSPVVVPA